MLLFCVFLAQPFLHRSRGELRSCDQKGDVVAGLLTGVFRYACCTASIASSAQSRVLEACIHNTARDAPIWNACANMQTYGDYGYVTRPMVGEYRTCNKAGAVPLPPAGPFGS
jgi:hypothetical protein